MTLLAPRASTNDQPQLIEHTTTHHTAYADVLTSINIHSLLQIMNAAFNILPNVLGATTHTLLITITISFVLFKVLFSSLKNTTVRETRNSNEIKSNPTRKKERRKGKRRTQRKRKERHNANDNEGQSSPNGSSFVEIFHELVVSYFSSKDTAAVDRPIVQFVGMDCEMVGYGRKGSLSMLARCSLVTLSYENSKDDDDSSAATPKIKVLYDVYVKPTKNVTDYRTQYSGIIPEHLESADAVNWEVCQSQVKRILKSNSEKTVILVGHALKNDFEVLRYWVSGSLFKFTLHINSMQ